MLDMLLLEIMHYSHIRRSHATTYRRIQIFFVQCHIFRGFGVLVVQLCSSTIFAFHSLFMHCDLRLPYCSYPKIAL
ncbi:hypothetical protein CC78DRAFT_531580 [Lojkania enalia]|uniref:Uncharacterized protein n=1 Tax=Lojkania enalia TaxID=147567 RepID=A0A9P4N521_9PLEO|nr:hypothetical protein CC78DRAFT_531580 [Didymosphaeria enalia]